MEISLKNIWEWITKSIVFIIVVAIIFGIGGYVYNQYFVDPVYEARVKFYANGLGTMENNPEYGVAVAPQYVEFLNGEAFQEIVSKDLLKDTGVNLSPAEIAGMLSFSSVVEETSTFYATVHSSDPKLAYNVALSVAEKAPERVKKIVNDGGELTATEFPKLPTHSIGSSSLKIALLGALLGFFLAAFAVVLKEIFDNSIKTPDEITQLFDIPVFGTVPDFSANNKKGEK